MGRPWRQARMPHCWLLRLRQIWLMISRWRPCSLTVTEARSRRAPKKPLIQFASKNKARGQDRCRTEAKLPHGYASQNPWIPHSPPTGKFFAAGSVTDCAEIAYGLRELSEKNISDLWKSDWCER